MKKMSDFERYKILLEIGLTFTLMISFAFLSNIDNIRWLFVDVKILRQTNGQVLSSKIEPGGIYGGWRFNIAYRYKVGELEFVSNRVHFGYQAEDNSIYAQNYVKKYPVGKQIVVFYDPNEPGNAVLEPEVKWNGLLDFYLIIALLPIAIFGLSFYFFIKNRQQRYIH
jgi:hypothetical protein